MSLFVDTSVWSQVFRCEALALANEPWELVRVIEAGEELVTTGLVLHELLQGFSGARNRRQILDRFAALTLLISHQPDHMGAAELKCKCRRAGIQVGTIDVLPAQLCLRHVPTMLTTDKGFYDFARHCGLKLGTVPT